MYYPEPIERLIENLARLPGIGKKTATRLAFFLLNAKESYISELSTSLLDIKEKIRLCGTCFNITDTDHAGYAPMRTGTGQRYAWLKNRLT